MNAQTLVEPTVVRETVKGTGPTIIAVLKKLRGLALLAVILLVWQLLGNPNSPYFPPPSSWVNEIVRTAASSHLWAALGATVGIFIASLLITVVVGALLGMALGASRVAENALNPLLQFLRAIPAAAIVPPVVLLLGPTAGMMVVVVVFASVWPVLLSTRSAMQNINPLLRDVSSTLNLSNASRFRKVLLPSLYPSILIGTTVAAPIALLITLLVQLLIGNSGIGGLLGAAQSQFDSAAVYGYVAISGILAIVVNAALRLVERSTTRHLSESQ